jgi:hypothetical protein
MSEVYLSPSNPGASTQAARDAAALANWNAIKNAVGNVNTTGSPVRVGLSGGNQGIVKLKAGIWWMSCGQQCTAALGFNNRVLWFAPGATVISSDATAGFIFTFTANVANLSVIGAPWTDTGNGAELATMANKTGAGWPTIAANLGGGDPEGPSITPNGDPRVPWTQPVKEMMSVGVDKLEWPWINNHCGFVNAQRCDDCEIDRQFYFGYREASSSGAAMMVPRATTAGGGVNGNGAQAPHNFRQANQFMINAPQGFGLNQWTDCRGFTAENLYCIGGECFRMETHVPNDGGIHNGVVSKIAQSGGNVGISWVPHDAKNGVVQISYVWNHSAEAGAFKVKQGRTGAVGSYAAGSFVRHVTSIGGNKTWAQKQTVPPGGSEGNQPTLPQKACIRDNVGWRNNVAVTGDIAFGHMNSIGITGGIPAGQFPGTAQGFQMGSGFGGTNASDGVAATTRDTTGPHPLDGGGGPASADLQTSGTLTPSATHTLVGGAAAVVVIPTRTGTLTPAASHVLAAVAVSLQAPVFERTPEDPSTEQAAFFRAFVSTPGSYAWRWQIDGQPVVNGAPSAMFDYRTFPVAPGEHDVTVYALRQDGQQTLPTTYSWLVPRIEIPAPSPGDLLGCGVYTVYVTARGGGRPLFSLPFTSLSWERVESATGSASILIDGISNYGEDCCKHLSELEPWKHEVRIYRDNQAMWWGAVTGRKLDNEQATVEARDLSVWSQRRRIGKQTIHVQADLATIAHDYWVDAMSRDRSPNVRFQTNLVGTLADRTVEANVAMVDDQMGELVNTGLSWGVTARTIVFGVRQVQTVPAGRLTDSSFMDQPAIDMDGLSQTNDLQVFGEGAGDDADKPEGRSRDQDSVQIYGLLEDVVTESDIKDSTSATEHARTQVDLLADPALTFDGGTLSTIAPVTINDLVAGGVIDIRLTQTCDDVAGIYRIIKVGGKAEASGQESIQLDVELSGNGG